MMSKTLKKSECFLRFILDPLGCTKQIKFILLNSSSIQLEVLTEIFHNILKNQNKFNFKVRKLIRKRKRLLTKFSSSFRKNNTKLQKKILINNFKIILHILITIKDIVFDFFGK